ncbi:hypothetical protein HPB51_010245 [Rhipicephalus microplus]|uniref:Uncharacterized protein n=1 Tax=Rhipicephalus microplus TaxID=6941 RepID=A0A9J6EFX3_RHIMP|nr:hypothetical protein HPB51_010245 [Rhipicephalus microplus]
MRSTGEGRLPSIVRAHENCLASKRCMKGGISQQEPSVTEGRQEGSRSENGVRGTGAMWVSVSRPFSFEEAAAAEHAPTSVRAFVNVYAPEKHAPPLLQVRERSRVEWAQNASIPLTVVFLRIPQSGLITWPWFQMLVDWLQADRPTMCTSVVATAVPLHVRRGSLGGGLALPTVRAP